MLATTMDPQRVTLRIVGKVQGVYYRESTRAEATRLGLTGWVRNLGDGSVELVAEGPSAALEGLVRWCRRGPPAAEVRDLERTDAAATGEFTGFTVRR